ncbi:hypothetical protein A9237_02560 [Vibrio owensii]|nr:hypothetical protein A9237_02560 [Vibrio owensii]
MFIFVPLVILKIRFLFFKTLVHYLICMTKDRTGNTKNVTNETLFQFCYLNSKEMIFLMGYLFK